MGMKAVVGVNRKPQWIYKDEVLKALNDLGSVTYYTSPVDYIVVQYNGDWWPYQKLQQLKAFKNLLPKINLEELVHNETVA